MPKRIAVDLAKSVYQIAESFRPGQVALRKRLNRAAFRQYIQNQAEPVEWLMEACGTAHHWGRYAQSLGHSVTLLHPRYVRPYRRRNKTDRNDCDAILEAARCQGILPVPVKSREQQLLQHLHALRETWKKSRVQRINLLRGIFREYGIETPASTERFIRAAHALAEHPDLKPLAQQLHLILAEINLYEQSMAECEQQMKDWHAEDEVVQRLDEVSGIGLLTASALKTAVGQPERFHSGRQLSAWLGMTPREHSSGQSFKRGSISRQGNAYVRTLLIHGARSALLAAQRCQRKTPDKMTPLQCWAVDTAQRIGHNKAAVALANKLVRVCWAVWCHQRRFSGHWHSVLPG